MHASKMLTALSLTASCGIWWGACKPGVVHAGGVVCVPWRACMLGGGHACMCAFPWGVHALAPSVDRILDTHL